MRPTTKDSGAKAGDTDVCTMPLAAGDSKRQPGRLAARVPVAFFEPLPVEVLDDWEAAHGGALFEENQP